jgi:hypothetical protein
MPCNDDHQAMHNAHGSVLIFSKKLLPSNSMTHPYVLRDTGVPVLYSILSFFCQDHDNAPGVPLTDYVPYSVSYSDYFHGMKIQREQPW